LFFENTKLEKPIYYSSSCPDNWGVIQGDDILKQQKEATTNEELEKLHCIQVEKNDIKVGA
jgi:hypothetical protein